MSTVIYICPFCGRRLYPDCLVDTTDIYICDFCGWRGFPTTYIDYVSYRKQILKEGEKMSNITEDVLLTDAERFKVLMEHTEDAFEDDQQNDALAIAQAQVQKMIEQGYLSPEQVKEYRKAIFDELDKYYVPQSLNECQLEVYNRLKDGGQSGFIKLNNTGSISFYGKNTEKCSFNAKMFWQSIKEETEKES